MTGRYLTTLMIAGLLLIFSLVAVAQDAPAPPVGGENKAELPDLEELIPPATLGFNPVVGSWLRYRLEDKLSGKTREFTLAVTGREPVEGHTASWIEISLESSNEMPVVIRALMVFSDPSQPAMKRLLLRTGNHHAVELNVGDIKPKAASPQPTYEDLGEATVTVEAGTFATQRYRRSLANGNVQNVWASPSLAPFGVVRSLSHAFEMELIAYGHDYQPKPFKAPYTLDLQAVPPKAGAAK